MAYRVVRWAALLPILLMACIRPEKPAAIPAASSGVADLRPVMAWALADSIAASYGLVPGLMPVGQELPENWLTRWPVGTGWRSLMPGRLPGLRAWLTRDSLTAYTYGEQAQDYSFQLRYPAFAGPRADSLRRTLGRISDLPQELAAVRRQRLYAAPEPPESPPPDAGERILDCEREETNDLHCFTLGAYVLETDTVVSTAGTTYSIGHCGHGTVGRVTGNFSLRQQRLLAFDDLFRPELRRALHHAVAGYALCYLQESWRDTQRAERPSLAQQSLDWYWQQWVKNLTEQEREQQAMHRLRQPHRPAREYAVYLGASLFNYVPQEVPFYFGPTGVVFFIGDDLHIWPLLVPYAALPRYLRCPLPDRPHRPRAANRPFLQ